MADKSNSWKTQSSSIVYDNNWVTVSHDDVVTPAGSEGIYGVVRFKHTAVGVIALESDHQLLIVGQYRYPLRQWSWEIPEGGCKAPEKPIECAKRELLEETGYSSADWSPFLTLHLSNSVTDEKAEVFLATSASISSSQANKAMRDDSEADMQVRSVSVEKALHMIASKEITDAISVAAIFKLANQWSSIIK